MSLCYVYDFYGINPAIYPRFTAKSTLPTPADIGKALPISFRATPYAGVIWGQPGVKLLSNALWPPNLVERTPDQSVMHCWGQRSCKAGVKWGQFVKQYLMPTKVSGKNPWPKRNALLGSKVIQGSAGVKKGSICLAMPYSHQIWWEEPPTRAYFTAGVKGHAGVNQW